MASTYVAGGRPGVRPLRQPDLGGVRGGARRARGRALPGVLLRARRGRDRPRPGRAGRRRWSRRGTPTTARVMQLADLEARGRLTRPAGRHHRHRRGRRRPATTRRWCGSSRRPTRRSRSPTSRRSPRPRTTPAPTSSSTTPSPLRCCQRPLSMGADLVVHSATKYIAGHADVLLGAVVTRDDQLYDVLKGRRDLIGAIPGTFETWLALRGLRTLHAAARPGRRPTRRSSSRRLGEHPAVGEVRYPGLRRDRRRSCSPSGADRGRPASPARRRCGCTPPPRRGGVDVRAPPPLEDRARHDPRRAGPARRSASRTSTTSGATSAAALDDVTGQPA